MTAADPQVPLRSGPPTHDELRVYYAPKFNWFQLKVFISSGDLGLLKRDQKLQERYMEWSEGIKEKYGSLVNFLQDYRLRWGEPDRISLLPTALDDSAYYGQTLDLPSKDVPYFTADTPSKLISIIQNDWPYSIPLDVEHTLIWTHLPVLPPPALLPPAIAESLSPALLERTTARLAQDGIWGFTGLLEPPPSPSLLPQAFGALTEWGKTLDSLVRSERGTEEEEAAVRRSGEEVAEFVRRRWVEREWETCWFVNPPRLQSVRGLAHIHVFARKKSLEEEDLWDQRSAQ